MSRYPYFKPIFGLLYVYVGTPVPETVPQFNGMPVAGKINT